MDKCTTNQPVTIDGKSLQSIPTPRRIDLKSLDQLRREMARVYRDTRQGRLDSQDASRFVYILGQIGKMIEMADFEKRLEQLEKANRG